MPGLVGFTRSEADSEAQQQTLRRMRELITHQKFYVQDEIFCEGSVYASRSHPNIIQKTPQPYHKDGVYVWMYGEFYNQKELIPSDHSNLTEDTTILAHLYAQQKDFGFLKDIDSYFVAVIYDSNTEQVHLITDRYGFSFLYWTIYKGELVWASELKAFLGLPEFTPKIDRQAVSDFISSRRIGGDHTWFEGVEMLSAASVMTWDIRGKTHTKKRYWWYSDVELMTGPIDEEAVAEEIGRLFIDAVDRRCRPGERVGLTLSGGLDSRAILAATPDRIQPVHAITFGMKGCDDIRIAARAVKRKGGVHHVVDISGENWLEPRINAVWWTDGQGSLFHLHRTAIIEMERDVYDINLNGLAGDLVAGYSVVSAPNYDCAMVLYDRVRRFTQSGTRLGEVFVWDRIPFFDKKFFDFVYSVPDRFKLGWRLYSKMLLKTFPEFYKNIPWQRTGHTIRWPYEKMKYVLYAREAKARAKQSLLKVMGIHFCDRRGYTDYPSWIRREPGKSFFEKMLFSDSTLSTEHISRRHLVDQWDCHMHGLDRADLLCRYLTFEIWLRQVYQKSFRPAPE